MSLPLNPPYRARPALTSDVPALINLSQRSCRDAEPSRIIVPQANQYPEEYVKFLNNRYALRLTKAANKATVVETDQHEIVACSIWDAEGDSELATAWKQDNAAHASPWGWLERYYLLLEHYYQRYILLHCVNWAGVDGIGKASRRVFADVPEQHLHLDILMVDPAYQGKGIAKALLQWGLQAAQEAQLPARLVSTSAGRPLYEKCGFQVVDYLIVEGFEHIALPGMVWMPQRQNSP